MDIKKFVNENKESAINDLRGWININSVDDSENASKGKPFGEGVYNALSYIADLARKEGFKVDTCDGYASEITVGDGEHLIAIYAHADVVPATGDWKYPPFEGVIVDNVMYGRGTSDDKGPAMAAFYALKAVRNIIENNKRYRVQLVIGGNEEKGSKCLEYYFDELKKPYPDYGFTPDGEFPLIYGEKGISNYTSSFSCDLSPVISIEAGLATNSVIDKAVALVKDKKIIDYLAKSSLNYEVKEIGENVEVIVKGKSAHGSTPELGVNAGLLLIKALGECYNLEVLLNLAKGYEDPFGKSMNLYFESELLHQTTYNVGIIEYKNGLLEVTVNFRYPEIVSPKEVVKKVDEFYNSKSILSRASEPLLVKPDSSLVKSLWEAYVDVTGDKTTNIMTIGGGTYARDSRNTIAFGSHFPGREDHIHEPNERINLEDFLLSIEIYAQGIMELLKL